ncbi:MAG: hypothetical protein U0V56_07590 [Actinomycetota bacterium]
MVAASAYVLSALVLWSFSRVIALLVALAILPASPNALSGVRLDAPLEGRWRSLRAWASVAVGVALVP